MLNRSKDLPERPILFALMALLILLAVIGCGVWIGFHEPKSVCAHYKWTVMPNGQFRAMRVCTRWETP